MLCVFFPKYFIFQLFINSTVFINLIITKIEGLKDYIWVIYLVSLGSTYITQDSLEYHFLNSPLEIKVSSN